MKVIKKNNFADIFPMRVKCERVVDKYGFTYGEEKDFCGSELEIEVTDIKRHDWQKYPDYSGTDYGVICPVCGKFIAIDTNKIPNKVLVNAEKLSLLRY